MSTRARDFFDDEADFEEMLEAADKNVSQTEDRVAYDFVQDMIEFQETYGLQTFMTQAQYDWLQRLSGK